MTTPGETPGAAIELVPGEDGAELCRISGVIDFSAVPMLWYRMAEVISRSRRLVVDLDGVTQVNSAGMALLLEARELAQRSQCRLLFRNLPSSLMNMIRMSEVDSFLPLEDDQQDAIQ